MIRYGPRMALANAGFLFPVRLFISSAELVCVLGITTQAFDSWMIVFSKGGLFVAGSRAPDSVCASFLIFTYIYSGYLLPRVPKQGRTLPIQNVSLLFYHTPRRILSAMLHKNRAVLLVEILDDLSRKWIPFIYFTGCFLATKKNVEVLDVTLGSQWYDHQDN